MELRTDSSRKVGALGEPTVTKEVVGASPGGDDPVVIASGTADDAGPFHPVAFDSAFSYAS